MLLFCNSLRVRNDCDKIIVKFIVKIVPNTNAFYKLRNIYSPETLYSEYRIQSCPNQILSLHCGGRSMAICSL